MKIEASADVSLFNFIAMMSSEQVCMNLFLMELSTYMSKISDLHIVSIILQSLPMNRHQRNWVPAKHPEKWCHITFFGIVPDYIVS